MTYRVEPLCDHELTTFDSGNPELDGWLRRHAVTATGQGTRPYVLVDDGGSVGGYLAVAPHLLVREDAPPRMARSAPELIAAIRLAKLALHSSIQGRGIGAEVLIDALDTIITAARPAGGRIVVVDAINEHARAFYEHHDFQPLPGQPQRLVMKASTFAQALGVPWP